MKKRRIIGNVLIVFALAFTAYLYAVMAHRIRTVVLKDAYTTILRCEMVACAFFLLFALDVRTAFLTKMKPKVLKAVGWLLRALIVFVVAALVFFMGRACVGSVIRTAEPTDYAIVLGLALEDGKPTADLISRLDTAEKYLKDAPGSTLILTGGNPDASGKSEADVMFDILLARGVPEDRMIVEDQADTTRANFINTAKMIDSDAPVVMISSDYHMARATTTAKHAGFTHIHRLPAPSSLLYYGSNLLSEAILGLNELTLRH